jgi:hypothetical protein
VKPLPRSGSSGEFLNGCRYSTAVSGAAVAHLFLKPVAECRRAESFAYIAHEGDNGGCKGRAVSLPGSDGVYQLFESGAGVAFPERNAAVEKSPEGSGCVVVTGQYQQGCLPSFKGINLPAVLRGNDKPAYYP